MRRFRLAYEEDYIRRLTTGGAIYLLTDLLTTTTCPEQALLRVRTGTPALIVGRELNRSCKQRKSIYVCPVSYQRARARHKRQP
jgi:hypothetical protein